MIVVGSTFRVENTLGFDVTNQTLCDFHLTGTATKASLKYPAVIDTPLIGVIHADIPAVDNQVVDTFRVWVEVHLPDGVIKKTLAKTIQIVPEGTVG